MTTTEKSYRIRKSLYQGAIWFSSAILFALSGLMALKVIVEQFNFQDYANKHFQIKTGAITNIAEY